MAFAPTIIERLARARADLRMGVPVVLSGETSVLVYGNRNVKRRTPKRPSHFGRRTRSRHHIAPR